MHHTFPALAQLIWSGPPNLFMSGALPSRSCKRTRAWQTLRTGHNRMSWSCPQLPRSRNLAGRLAKINLIMKMSAVSLHQSGMLVICGRPYDRNSWQAFLAQRPVSVTRRTPCVDRRATPSSYSQPTKCPDQKSFTFASLAKKNTRVSVGQTTAMCIRPSSPWRPISSGTC